MRNKILAFLEIVSAASAAAFIVAAVDKERGDMLIMAFLCIIYGVLFIAINHYLDDNEINVKGGR